MSKTNSKDYGVCVKFLQQCGNLTTTKETITILSRTSTRSTNGWKSLISNVKSALNNINNPGDCVAGVAATGLYKGIDNAKDLIAYTARKTGKEERTVDHTVRYVLKVWEYI